MASETCTIADMRILSIETSCDETALAVVEANGGLRAPRFRILKNLVASQIKIHRPFGGVVPSLAKREHLKNLPILFRRIFNISKLNFHNEARLPKIDLIAVTVGPGLEPALWSGINFAKEIAKKYKKPVVGANHLEGHLYSFLLPSKTKNHKPKAKSLFPTIALLVSGGHTILLKMETLAKWKELGETRDDAAGEAFDKVARLLKLPYPGGPEIEKLAIYGSSTSIDFPRPMLDQKNYDFSFSGLKTSVLYYLRDNSGAKRADVAASFQQAVVDVLAAKTMRAAREFGAESVALSGGVAANKALRKALSVKCRASSVGFFVPDFKYNLDNAAMIAAAGYFANIRKKKYPLRARGDLGI